ncbi:MAG TPA: hypothetical protein VFP94_05000, partial [Terriglobales bacterium]|nr:hypothetical protein [Terriglobales bacterium]
SLSGATPVDVSVAVTTTSRSLLLPPAGSAPPTYPSPEWLLWALLALALAGALAVPRRSRRMALGSLAFGLLALSVACGGGGSSAPVVSKGGGGNSNPSGTPAGTYVLTVTASNGSVSRSIPLTLTVN